jgi:hypothetical protein
MWHRKCASKEDACAQNGVCRGCMLMVYSVDYSLVVVDDARVDDSPQHRIVALGQGRHNRLLNYRRYKSRRHPTHGVCSH